MANFSSKRMSKDIEAQNRRFTEMVSKTVEITSWFKNGVSKAFKLNSIGLKISVNLSQNIISSSKVKSQNQKIFEFRPVKRLELILERWSGI